ncbi:MAG TPA: DUF3800 domain-containing protein [Pyrinomonadaceae bacterium]|nr:DUF3800 domain-containing protein [Pyrinomonadaceae bacterium]
MRIVYLDETCDHSLQNDDKDFPVFALVMMVCDLDQYRDTLIPMVHRLKFDYFGHECIILHSRDIRKTQKDFGFLTDPLKRREFYGRINEIMSAPGYDIIAAVIKKPEYKAKCGSSAINPYDLALTFAVERLLNFLEREGQTEVYLIAEARGKREDAELRVTFLHILTYGTDDIPAERFAKINFHLRFKPKVMNVVGTQLADLAAYPIARHIIINPAQSTPAYDIVKKRYCVGSGRMHGLKVFP